MFLAFYWAKIVLEPGRHRNGALPFIGTAFPEAIATAGIKAAAGERLWVFSQRRKDVVEDWGGPCFNRLRPLAR